MALGELAPHLVSHCSGRAGTAIHLGEGSWQRPRLTNLATTQAHIQGFELTHSNIYPIYDLLEHMKVAVLCNRRCRSSMT